jgi:hypothetical protein
MSFFRSVCVLALLAAAPAAQCNTVAFTTWGVACSVFGQPANIGGAWDPARCQLTIAFPVARTCCNTFPFAHLVLLGARGFDPGLPHPLLVPGCLLYVDPLVVVPLARSQAPQIQLTLPRLPAVSLFAQGVNDYFTTLGMTHDLQTTDGLRIDLR